MRAMAADSPPVLTELAVHEEVAKMRALPPRMVHTLELAVLVVAVAACVGLGVRFGDGGWVAAVLLACLLAFRGALWLVARRARYIVIVDFGCETVFIEDVRGLDAPQRAIHSLASVDRIEVADSGSEIVLGLVWKGEDAAAIQARLPNDHPGLDALVRLIRAAGL